MKNKSTDKKCGCSVCFHAGSNGIVSVFESVSLPRIAFLSLPNISIDLIISFRVTGILLMELSFGIASSDGKNSLRRTRAASSAFLTSLFVYLSLFILFHSVSKGCRIQGIITVEPSYSFEEQGIISVMLNCVIVLIIVIDY